MTSPAWTGRMIASDSDHATAPILRRSFELAAGHGTLVRADVLATALGICEVFINGRAAAPDVLTPGWSSYEWRLRYARWDVTKLIEQTSMIGMIIGAGWHSGRLGFAGGRALYGDVRAGWLELGLHYEDGFTQRIVTDDSWESGASAITSDDLYDGEVIDARLVDASWSRPESALAHSSGVTVLEFDTERLTPYVAPPVRRQEEVRPQRTWTSPSGATLVDFGQNLVGWTRLRASGQLGAEVTLRHAEVLENDELATAPLRTARATDLYILSGADDEFEPTFTFHGFRYVEVKGWPGTLDDLTESIAAVVIGSDLRRTGWFECSDPLLNQLHANIVWSMRGNFVDVPTDCPQRDERLGWTGDLAAFIGTAVFLYDVGDFARDWLLDLAEETAHHDGFIPLVVPDNFKYENRAGLTQAMQELEYPVAALWNDAACWVPWAAWRAYGDLGALGEAYPSMAAYARRIGMALSDDGILRGIQLGDWLDPSAPADEPWRVKANPYVVATACVYRSVRIAEDAATILGHPDDAEELALLASRIRRAFNDEFVDNGRIESDATTVYALAIAFGLVDGPDADAAGERLTELVREANYRVTTGFAGTPFITGALSDTGHLDVAYRLILETGCPSWLYPVTMGATTTWERWDSLLPDGSVNPSGMTSFNHYAFGAIGEWMHSTIGGISSLEAGYRSVLIAPRPGGGITWANTRLVTPHGPVSVQWSLDGQRLVIDAEVPDGCSGLLRMPGRPDQDVPAGQHRFVEEWVAG